MFTENELTFLAAQRLCRLATVSADGAPHVVPVGFEYNAELNTIDIVGYAEVMRRSRKFRDVTETGQAAIVVDELESVDPWRPRGIEIRGKAEALGADTDTPLIRITPYRLIGWGIDGDRFGPMNARNV
ncbi:PPOX class F420-dependent oxidoreductase [Amycolatopsis sp. cg5]|uniref:PPOX class F420-dependent oxidoreductase n=1 Tax=Amycolatopsis sp. cg5 TaxID=3238802 RepID=UPI003525E329